MENEPDTREADRLLLKWTAIAIGLIALASSCLPRMRVPNEEQRHDPNFMECVSDRLTNDEFNPPKGPQGVYIGPTAQEIAEDRCLDDLFPR